MTDSELERLRNFLNENDSFAKENNMQITLIREGYAEGVFSADARHRNGLGIIQGGALFTLADFTFAGALNSFGRKGVGMGSSVSFLRPGTGTKFTAKANVLRCGKRTGVFTVEVYDEKENLILHSTMTGAILNEPTW